MEPETPERSTLHVEAARALKHRRQTLTVADVADATGLTIHWLNALIQDRIDEPSALKLEKLRDFFADDAKRMRDDV